MITDGTQSHAVFTYLCGAMTWHGNATIGFNTDGSFFVNHPLSGTSSANQVACLNYPTTVWKNLVYPLNPQIGETTLIAGLLCKHCLIVTSSHHCEFDMIDDARKLVSCKKCGPKMFYT